MQKAPVLKGSGLQPVNTNSEETHVFGKNLEERVIADEGEQSNDLTSEPASSSTPTPATNDIESIKKRKYDATTGEEDEDTIFQGDFKLFVWQIPNWVEKGRGQLKLNTSSSSSTSDRKSRLIMRINGTLRIILNVSIKYSHFKLITHSKTNLRFTDSQTVWAVSGSNAQELKRLIEEQLDISKEEDKSPPEKKSPQKEESPSEKESQVEKETTQEAENSPEEKSSPQPEEKSSPQPEEKSPPREENSPVEKAHAEGEEKHPVSELPLPRHPAPQEDGENVVKKQALSKD